MPMPLPSHPHNVPCQLVSYRHPHSIYPTPSHSHSNPPHLTASPQYPPNPPHCTSPFPSLSPPSPPHPSQQNHHTLPAVHYPPHRHHVPNASNTSPTHSSTQCSNAPMLQCSNSPCMYFFNPFQILSSTPSAKKTPPQKWMPQWQDMPDWPRTIP